MFLKIGRAWLLEEERLLQTMDWFSIFSLKGSLSEQTAFHKFHLCGYNATVTNHAGEINWKSAETWFVMSTYDGYIKRNGLKKSTQDGIKLEHCFW